MKTVDLSGKPFHFIGIGGIGMSALAYVLAKRNIPVSGSDVRRTHITDRLEAVGTHVFQEQVAANLELFLGSGLNGSSVLPQVICSTAIGDRNGEFQAAQLKGCDIFHRSDLLAALVAEYESVAVAGTHGKTTTSSLIGYVLLEAGLDPTIIVGGEVDAWGGNARLGLGKYLVAEADESDGTLVKLKPLVGVVTNMELDHPDHYEDMAAVINTFLQFSGRCQVVVGCLDCPTVREYLPYTLSYSLDPEMGADYWATDVVYGALGTQAKIWERGTCLGEVTVSLLGQHNLSNALAAIAVSRYLGVEFAAIAQGLSTFGGAKRRFEVKGKRQGITFIDDYAHHPSELQATLAAARLRVQPGKRVVAIFQPHRYSRTLSFLEEFAQSFKDADWVIITDIYSAGEPNTHNLTGEQLPEAIAQHHPHVNYHADLKTLPQRLFEELKDGDLVLFLGAGNLNQTIPQLLTLYPPEI